MARKKHLINVHTSTGTTAPTEASLYLGEIAVQHTTGDPALWIKVGSAETSTEYEKFIGKTEITNLFNQSQILGSGYTYSGLSYVNSATSIADAYSALTNELFDDELVTAAALNDLNNKVNELSATTQDFHVDMILGSGYTYSGISYVNSATSIADAYSALTNEVLRDELTIAAAFNDLNDRINNIPEPVDVEPLSACVVNNVQSINILSAAVEANELVTAAALNDLNNRIIRVSGMAGDNTEIFEYIQENEEVTAAALNELNERVGVVETHMTGDYIPITGYMLPSGITEEELALSEEDTVNEALGKLQKQMLDNEEAIAAGLNDLNTRVEANAAAIAQNTGVTALSGAVQNLSAGTLYGLNYLWNRFSGYTTTSTTQNLSGAVVDLANRPPAGGLLTISLNGVEQGRYSPSGDSSINLEVVTEVTGDDVLLTGYELASGTTEEELAITATDTVNEAFGKIQKQNYDNEAVVAGALNDLDERIMALEAGGGTEAVIELVEALSATLEDDEYVISAAFNDLNDRIISLSGNAMDPDDYYIKDQVDALIAGVDPELAIAPLSAAVVTLSANTGGGGSDVTPLSGAVISLSAAVVTISGSSGPDTATTEAGHYTPTTSASTKGTTAATTNFVKGIRVDSKNHVIDVVTGAPDVVVIRYGETIPQSVLDTFEESWGDDTNPVVLLKMSDGRVATFFAQKAETPYGYIFSTTVGTAPDGVRTFYYAYESGDWSSYNVKLLASGTTLDSIPDGATRKLSDYATTGTVNSLSAATTAMSANVAKIAVTGVTVTGTGNAVTDASYSNSALTLTKGNVLTAETLTGVSLVGTAVTLSSKVAPIPSASSSVFGVVKTGNFITNTNGSIAVSTGTTNTTVARGDQFLAVSAATTGNTSNLNTLSGAAHNKITNLSAATTAISTNLTTLSGAAHTKITNLSAATTAISTNLTTLSGAAHTKITNLSAATTAHTATTIANGTSSQMHLPTVTSSDNNKVLMVSGGTWVLTTPITVYTGGGTPDQNLGTDGDMYLQTS